jgi:hypothetical protein
MCASRHLARLLALALLLAPVLFAATLATPASADTGDDAALASVRTTLSQEGLLADPLALSGAVTTLGEMSITHRLSATEPQVEVAWDSRDASGLPIAATAKISRHITGKLDIEHRDATGSARFTRKNVNDDAVRQVTLRRAGGRWRVATMSAEVLASSGGRTQLPLVDLNTRGVSSGFLSVLSDLDELAVHPQTCAVTAPGDSVRVFVSGVDRDAIVTVFANGRSFAARSDGNSHFEIALQMGQTTRLQSIGVTVFSRASVYDPAAPADSRTWIMPILVGAAPASGEEYFGS